MPQKQRRQQKLATIIKFAQYAIDEKLAQEIPKVLNFLLDAVHNSNFEPRERIQAAKFLLEYFMPKKSPLVSITQNQDNRRVEIKHVSHLGIPTGEAEIPENLPPIPPQRRLVDVTEVDAASMIPPERPYVDVVPQDQLPPTDISKVKVADEPIEAPLEIAPLLRQDQPKWRKGFW